MIYFIEGEDSKRIKIGESDNPVKRLMQLATGPEPVRLLAVMPGGKFRETDLHEKFHASHRHREWFERSPELDRFISELTNGGTERVVECLICGMKTLNIPLKVAFIEGDKFQPDKKYRTTYSDVIAHCKHHLDIRKGALPYSIREFMKSVSWSILSKEQHTIHVDANFRQEDAKRTIAFAWWARSRERGLPDKAFEDYMLDYLDYLDAKMSNDIEKLESISKTCNDRWGKYG